MTERAIIEYIRQMQCQGCNRIRITHGLAMENSHHLETVLSWHWHGRGFALSEPFKDTLAGQHDVLKTLFTRAIGDMGERLLRENTR